MAFSANITATVAIGVLIEMKIFCCYMQAVNHTKHAGVNMENSNED